MCKYLSRVSGPARVAICWCMIALQRSCTHPHAHTGAILCAEAAVCIGEPCEYMHKNVCFHVPALVPLLYPSAAILAYMPGRRCRRRHRRAYVPCENVFGSRTCQPNAIRHVVEWLRSWPTSAGWQCNHVSVPPPFYPRERQPMRMLPKRTTNFVFEYRFVWLLHRAIVCRCQAREVAHNFGLYRVRPEFLAHFISGFFYINDVPWRYMIYILYFTKINLAPRLKNLVTMIF